MDRKSNKAHVDHMIRNVLEYIGVKPLNEMALNEMSPKIKRVEGEELTIEYSGATHIDTYYFKVHDGGDDYRKAKKVCRISLLKPKYAPWHPKSEHKNPLNLDADQVRWLVDRLAQTHKKYKNMTNLQYLIDQANQHNEKRYIDPNSIKPENYLKLINQKQA